MSDKLKPCPACGGEARRSSIPYVPHDRYPYMVFCSGKECGFRTAHCETQEDADAYWNRRPLAEKRKEESIGSILIDNCSCGGAGVLESYRDRLNGDYLLHRVRCERCGLCTHLCTDGIIAQRAWRHLKNDKDAAWARNYFLREAERVGIKDPEQYLKPKLRENKYNLPDCKYCGGTLRICTYFAPSSALSKTAGSFVECCKCTYQSKSAATREEAAKLAIEHHAKKERPAMSSHNRETLLQAGRAMGCKECGRHGMLMLHYNDHTGDKNRPADGYYVMHPPDRNCSVWNLHRLQPATAIHSQAKEAIEEWNEKFGRKPETKPTPTCGNCRFGVLCGSRPNVHRQCQKCSPYVNKDGASKWPRVGDHDWCGDHEYKEAPDA